MKIHDTRTPAIQPGTTPATPVSGVSPTTAAGGDPTGPAESRRTRRDSVELSPAAQAMTTGATDPASSSLGPERLAEIRQRIQSGAYDSLAVVDEVARRILDHGDV